MNANRICFAAILALGAGCRSGDDTIRTEPRDTTARRVESRAVYARPTVAYGRAIAIDVQETRPEGVTVRLGTAGEALDPAEALARIRSDYAEQTRATYDALALRREHAQQAVGRLVAPRVVAESALRDVKAKEVRIRTSMGELSRATPVDVEYLNGKLERELLDLELAVEDLERRAVPFAG